MTFLPQAARSLRTISHVRAAIPRPGATRVLPMITIQRRLLSEDLRARIEQDVKGNNMIVYIKGTPDAPQCGFSRAVVQMLQAEGVRAYAYINILENEEMRSGLKEYSQWPTFPQVYVKGEFVGGCDIVMGMSKSGELTTLLKKEGIVSADAEGQSETSS
ncbi:thioredoxin-like protein [Cladochytrium replicatum]|nr:thioredoxin-like protein [Cladochytrium replicatum]